jgi:hypothetical protein
MLIPVPKTKENPFLEEAEITREDEDDNVREHIRKLLWRLPLREACLLQIRNGGAESSHLKTRNALASACKAVEVDGENDRAAGIHNSERPA